MWIGRKSSESYFVSLYSGSKSLGSVQCSSSSIWYARESIYQNMSYLLQTMNSNKVSLLIRRFIPGILWILCKKKNKISFILDGRPYKTNETIKKISEDSRQWLQAQNIWNEEIKRSWILFTKVKRNDCALLTLGWSAILGLLGRKRINRWAEHGFLEIKKV